MAKGEQSIMLEPSSGNFPKIDTVLDDETSDLQSKSEDDDDQASFEIETPNELSPEPREI